jgi:hypothetical protein
LPANDEDYLKSTQEYDLHQQQEEDEITVSSTAV